MRDNGGAVDGKLNIPRIDRGRAVKEGDGDLCGGSVAGGTRRRNNVGNIRRIKRWGRGGTIGQRSRRVAGIVNQIAVAVGINHIELQVCAVPLLPMDQAEWVGTPNRYDNRNLVFDVLVTAKPRRAGAALKVGNFGGEKVTRVVAHEHRATAVVVYVGPIRVRADGSV